MVYRQCWVTNKHCKSVNCICTHTHVRIHPALDLWYLSKLRMNKHKALWVSLKIRSMIMHAGTKCLNSRARGFTHLASVIQIYNNDLVPRRGIHSRFAKERKITLSLCYCNGIARSLWIHDLEGYFGALESGTVFKCERQWAPRWNAARALQELSAVLIPITVELEQLYCLEERRFSQWGS